ncbi:MULTISPECIES: hypothetical protein [Pseudoalteromonas]|uniref:hypothetical protein n=1 Tax=Pseudoalteromonas TaxID=53246 RepID=UPI0015817963|nr:MULTISPECIES: hypothetical protein [Pseudoalteromonas]MDI4654498.1 hypothetical protein [Pseudoalteromonas shioyasakiensis]NUJ39401.1 hypothetical protein [Pseudoalteromonas sp. 0303]
MNRENGIMIFIKHVLLLGLVCPGILFYVFLLFYEISPESFNGTWDLERTPEVISSIVLGSIVFSCLGIVTGFLELAKNKINVSPRPKLSNELEVPNECELSDELKLSLECGEFIHHLGNLISDKKIKCEMLTEADGFALQKFGHVLRTGNPSGNIKGVIVDKLPRNEIVNEAGKIIYKV